jgi:hypothetical protein
MAGSVIALLLDAVDEAYDRRSWHGTNLRGSLRGLTVEDALRRPQPGRHNIWEIAVHAAYWKYVVTRAIVGGKRGSFACKGSNWFGRSERDEAAWRRDLDLLAKQHRELRAAVAGLDPRLLDKPGPRGRSTYAGLIRGAAAHDLYHAGQIQLLKRLRR